MFQSLSDRLAVTFKKIRGQGRLTEDNIKKALREVRAALLEADVALPVVQAFISKVKKRALGREVAKSLSPGQAILKIVKHELTEVMGEACVELDLKAQPPVVILMAGLQGSGKTTTTAKLAKHLTEVHKKKVLTVSVDVYRPAAIEQLKTLSAEVGVDWFASDETQAPKKITTAALAQAKKQGFDVLLIDTAGRLHIDDDMMAELKDVHAIAQPVETLFVIDSMMGQDAVNTAKAFNDLLPLTGVVLTKADGDARGGAALSVRHVTEKPIKFIGVGEKIDALEPFYPDRIASRILGMGDVLSLIESVEQNVDRAKADRMAKKLKKGKGFDLSDFAEQLRQMDNMGGLSGLASKIPGMSNVPDAVKNQIGDGMTKKTLAIIDSMTLKERRTPDLIKGSRKRRIAAGSGTEIQDVNKLLKQFTQMQKMMKKMGKAGGMAKMMRSMQGMMPPGGGSSLF